MTPEAGEPGQRLDKWLWAVRIFKTRALAAEACKKGKVMVNDLVVRASKNVQVQDRVRVALPGIERIYRVTAVIEKRVGPKLVGEAVVESMHGGGLFVEVDR
mgnify:CR=1 FL=1